MYEVHSNYGGALFKDVDDAISAFMLLAPYHDDDIERKEVEEALNENGYYEDFTLSIVSC